MQLLVRHQERRQRVVDEAKVLAHRSGREGFKGKRRIFDPLEIVDKVAVDLPKLEDHRLTWLRASQVAHEGFAVPGDRVAVVQAHCRAGRERIGNDGGRVGTWYGWLDADKSVRMRVSEEIDA